MTIGSLPDSDAIAVSVDERSNRFTADAGAANATLSFRRRANRFIVTHTVVPPGLEGRGLGGQLVSAAVAYAAQRNLTVVPLCPFALAWLRGHPEVALTATVEWPTPSTDPLRASTVAAGHAPPITSREDADCDQTGASDLRVE